MLLYAGLCQFKCRVFHTSTSLCVSFCHLDMHTACRPYTSAILMKSTQLGHCGNAGTEVCGWLLNRRPAASHSKFNYIAGLFNTHFIYLSNGFEGSRKATWWHSFWVRCLVGTHAHFNLTHLWRDYGLAPKDLNVSVVLHENLSHVIINCSKSFLDIWKLQGITRFALQRLFVVFTLIVFHVHTCAQLPLRMLTLEPRRTLWTAVSLGQTGLL